MESDGAQTYLDQRAAELNREGVLADYETARGDPARAIIASARRLSADLVVMGTHGRAGADAFWAGSVAARVVARIQAPVMLVPLGKSDEQRFVALIKALREDGRRWGVTTVVVHNWHEAF